MSDTASVLKRGRLERQYLVATQFALAGLFLGVFTLMDTGRTAAALAVAMAVLALVIIASGWRDLPRGEDGE